MMIGTFGGISFIWVAAIAAVAVNSNTHTISSSHAFVAMIFLFNAVFAFGITPLQALFPVEVLSFEMRAKGMAFSNLAVNIGGLLNQFAWPVALANITWKTFIVFTVQDAAQAAIIWWMIPETKGRTVSLSRHLSFLDN